MVAGRDHVVIHNVRQPGEVVRESGAHAASALRMPPVLNVALEKLAGRGPEYVLPRHYRLGVHECHHILKLVAEAVSAAALIERRAGPHAAGERLVQRPTVDHRIEGGLRRLHGNTREPLVPQLHICVDGSLRSLWLPVIRYQTPRFDLAPGRTEENRDLPGLACRQVHRTLKCRTRVDTHAADTAERAARLQRGG